MSCLFCNIAQGDLPANILYQDEQVFMIDDINPQAPHHKLIIPKEHIPTINALTPANNLLIGHMFQVAKQEAQALQIAENGYRVVMNCNSHGGQTVFHIHLHLLGGRQFNWPPG